MSTARNSIYSLSYGLEIIEGLMGAGKSYYSVRRLCQTIEETRRPAYTNLPIKWPVMRAYLRIRGGEDLARLIHPLKEEHWRRFLRRQFELAKFREHYTGRSATDLEEKELEQLIRATGRDRAWLLQQPKIRDSQLFDWFRLHFGPEIYDGHNADSIYPGALIVLDEVQHWHPMLKQGTDPAREQLQAYLTMCRHHMHWIWVITQDRSRIDIIFRNLAASIWRVWDRGEDRLMFGLRFKHFGMRGMGYERYTREQLEGRNPDDAAPSESFTILPQLPRNKVFFRLYASVTNVGSKRDIERAIRQARQAAGISQDGTTDDEQRRKEHEAMKQTTKKPLHRRLIRTGIRACVLVAVVTAAFAVGQLTNPQTEPIADAQEPQVRPHNWPHFSGVTASRPLIDYRPAVIGQRIGDRATLRYYDPKNRSIVLVADDAYWLWEYGDTLPSPVGPVDEVRAAYQRMESDELQRTPVGDEATAGS